MIVLHPEMAEPIRAAFAAYQQVQQRKQAEAFERRLKRSSDPDLVPADLTALIDYARSDALSYPILGFNGQLIRAGLLLTLMRNLRFDAFIETGTFRGETCFLVAAQTTLPIRSCDLPHRAETVATVLSSVCGEAVQLSRMDSREFLMAVLRDSRFQKPFFYLDAHWEDDLPLLGELAEILKSETEFVIAIDDFRVPGDQGFGFDEYPKAILQWDYIAGTVKGSGRQVGVFYPCYPSTLETGSKRGFILLSSKGMTPLIEAALPPGFLRPPDQHES